MPQTLPGRKFQAPERTVERRRGCWNCRHFIRGPLAEDYYRTRKALEGGELDPLVRLSDGEVDPLEVKHLDPDTIELPEAPAPNARFKLFDIWAKHGIMGLCGKGSRPSDMGGPEGDFVHMQFLCDRWDAADGASLATGTDPVDDLPAELKDKIDPK